MEKTRISVYIAASLDGYIAREDGALDWLPQGDGKEDYGYGEFMSSIDALVMGRKTFETVLSFGEWPYPDIRVFVLSGTLRKSDVPDAVAEKIEILNGTPPEIVAELAKRGVQRAYLDGGATIQGFLRFGLIDDMTLTRVPVLLGRGIPLFGSLEKDISLRHVNTRAFPDGLVQSVYENKKDAAS